MTLTPEEIALRQVLDYFNLDTTTVPKELYELVFSTVNSQPSSQKFEAQLKAERERAEYWSKRCLAAENCLDKSPCDPDITKAQIEAFQNWEAAKKNE